MIDSYYGVDRKSASDRAQTYARRVTESADLRLVNIVGAFALALSDEIRDATEAAAGMTGAAPAALVALRQFLAGRTTEDLARATGLTHSGAVRLVDRLVDAGLAERQPGSDGRSLSIVLTGPGRTLSQEITEARRAAIESSLGGLEAIDHRPLLELVEVLVAALTARRLDRRNRGDEPPGALCRLCDLASCRRSQGACPAANAAHAALAESRGARAGGIS